MIGSQLTMQQQLFNKVRLLYPDAIAKKIDKDNFVDIFIASVHEKKGWHLFFNTAKDKIKSGFYCRDTEFVEKVLATDQAFELYSQGIRLLNNPEFTDPDLAVHAAENLLIKIREAYCGVSENKSSDPILDQKNVPTEDDQQEDDQQEDDQQEDNNKGFPTLSLSMREDEEGNNDEELNARIKKYLVNWLCPTEAYAGRLGIEAHVPTWIGKIDNDNCCPKFSDREMELINNKILSERIIPILNYAPEEFHDQTKQIWWIVPFNIWAEDDASWLMVDKNGIYGAHPGDDNIAMIASWDRLVGLEYRSFDIDTDEEIHTIYLLFDDGMMSLVEFVPPGMGSYLSVIESIYEVRYETIQASKGAASWYEGVGGEGFKSFEKPRDLLIANKWEEPFRPDPKRFGYDVRTEEEKMAEHHLRQGKEKHKNKDFQGAILEFTKVIEIDPENANAFTGRGSARLKLEDYDGAVADLSKSIEIDPSDDSTYQQRGRCKFILEDFAGAIEDFDKAITLDPNSWVFYYDRGDAKKNSKDFKGAIADYNKVIELNPSDDSTYQQRGRCKSELKDFAGAIEDFDKAIAIKPNRWGYYYDRGNAKKNSKDFKGAMADFNKVIELNPSHHFTYHDRGQCKSELKDFTGAIEDFDKAITLDPNMWGYYFNRGNAKKNSKDFKGAMADYNKVSELNPSYKWTFQERGKCKSELKDFVGAIEDFSKVIKIDPNYKWAFQERGVVKNALKDHKGAIEDLNRVIAIDPDYRWAYEPLGVAKKALEDLQGAIQAFDIGIEKDAQWPSIRYNRAKTKHLIKDFKGAIEDYEELINSESFDLGVFYNLQLAKKEEDCFEGDLKEDGGSISTEAYKNALVVRANRFSRQGNNKKAIEDINELIGMDPSLGYPYCYLGNFKLKSKDYQGAIEALNTAIEKNEDLFYSYRDRADAKKGLNDYTGALADYTKVIEIDPDDDTAYKGRGLVKMLLKDFKGAIEDFTKFIDISQRHNYDFVFFERGKAKFQLGEYKGAFEDMNEAIEIDPKYAPYYFERGSLKKELNDQKGALVDYNKAVLLDPEKIEFYSSRSELKFIMGDEQGAALDSALSEFYGLPADERPQSDYLKINLLKLIEHKGETDFEQIKNSVIANAILDESEFDRLAKDVNFIVRAATALNPHISENLLSELLRDKEKLVRLTAHKNTTLTDYMIENLPKEITIKELLEKLFGEGEAPDSGTPAADLLGYKYELEVTVEDAIWIENEGFGCQRPNPGDIVDPQAKETIIIEAADYVKYDGFKNNFIESFNFQKVEDGPISKVELEDWINESIRTCIDYYFDNTIADTEFGAPNLIDLNIEINKRYCLEDLNPEWKNETYFVIEG